jgi:hypothetical protein
MKFTSKYSNLFFYFIFLVVATDNNIKTAVKVNLILLSYGIETPECYEQ